MLGEGTYGEVENVNGMAVKHFKREHTMLQELIPMLYLDSRYVLKCEDYNLNENTITSRLYDYSLKDVMNLRILTRKHKNYVIRSLLRGLADMHERDIVHSDLKPSNILISLNPLKCVICDLGLSGIDGYAFTQYCARKYRSSEIFSTQLKNDMYSLCIILYELIIDRIPRHMINRRGLLKLVNRLKPCKIKSIMLLCLDDNYIGPKEILDRYFHGYIPNNKVILEEIPDKGELLWNIVNLGYQDMSRNKVGYRVCYILDDMNILDINLENIIRIVFYILSCITGCRLLMRRELSNMINLDTTIINENIRKILSVKLIVNHFMKAKFTT